MNGFESLVGPLLAATLERKGYTSFTSVQDAVLDPALAGRDLRITSQTGSGKTVAVGLAIRDLLDRDATPKQGGIGRPIVLVVTPTRELAKQVEQELSWLYADLGVRVASATGGASVRDERRALALGPTVVVGTPGRLLDHLERGAIDPSQLAAMVIDEADRMLDMGFRDDLEAILKFAPADRRTHLMSATFPREVRQLADRVQRAPAHVEGTRLGAANVDIDHVVHLVDPRQKVDAIVNLLLSDLEAQTLVFARTRADVARIAKELSSAGFKVSSLSGEMEQAARNRALASFKRGDLHVLVATDVAARGIDVQDISRVIHAEPPTDADSYTHRSGRTGRAGRKGTSSVLVAPSGLSQATRVLRAANVAHRFEPIPQAEDIRRAADERLLAELSGEDPEGGFGERTWSLATRLVEGGHGARAIARLLVRAGYAGKDSAPVSTPDKRAQLIDARDVRAIAAPEIRKRPVFEPPAQPRPSRDQREQRHGVPFRVSWGTEQGADARRILAVVCRRGGIRGGEVGAIRLARNYAIVEVASDVAEAFAKAASEPDPRDPRIVIRRESAEATAPNARAAQPLYRAMPKQGDEIRPKGHFGKGPPKGDRWGAPVVHRDPKGGSAPPKRTRTGRS